MNPKFKSDQEGTVYLVYRAGSETSPIPSAMKIGFTKDLEQRSEHWHKIDSFEGCVLSYFEISAIGDRDGKISLEQWIHHELQASGFTVLAGHYEVYTSLYKDFIEKVYELRGEYRAFVYGDDFNFGEEGDNRRLNDRFDAFCKFAESFDGYELYTRGHRTHSRSNWSNRSHHSYQSNWSRRSYQSNWSRHSYQSNRSRRSHRSNWSNR